MPLTIVTGARDPLGRRVLERLAAAGKQARAIGEDELLAPGLKLHFDEGCTLVHLAGGLEETRAVLDAAGDGGARHVVVLSSATVYGAWPANPIPLTEDAVLSPNPELDLAVRAAERERLASEWELDHPGTTTTILRPATPVSAELNGWLAEGLLLSAQLRAGTGEDPPAQFVDLDDLADAVVLAATAPLKGAYNVAPDGWISGEGLRALAGGPRLRLPDPMAGLVLRLRRRLGPRAAHPGLAPYVTHPWVVANDRLRAEGWVPRSTNEEAFVAGHRPAPWATVSPRRRQELALAVTGVVGLGALAGVIALVRRALRRRAPGSP